METKTELVAVEYNDSGTCKKVFHIKNLTKTELNKLLNESAVSKQHGLKKAQAQEERLLNLEGKIEKDSFFIAKSIYDNFVDRGLFEEDYAFQKLWYDFIFRDMLIGLDQLPKELKKIYEFVRGKDLDNEEND